MTTKSQIWKCEICGNIVEVLHDGADALVCCGQPMKLKPENSQGEYAKKHAPVILSKFVKVGEVEHPMTEEHHIEWVEGTDENGEVEKVFLKPGQKPEAEFCFRPLRARMYCNIHGLWESE